MYRSKLIAMQVRWYARAAALYQAPARAASTAVLVAAFSLFCVGQQPTADDSISIDTKLVIVPTTVMDKEGRHVLNLEKDSFTVLENGAPQQLAFFGPARQPISILLLIENGCTLGGFRSGLLKVANTIADELESEDRLAFATICDDSPLRFEFELRKKVDLKRPISFEQKHDVPFNFTYDSLERSFEYMSRIKGPKAIVLLSNGAMYGRDASAKKILYLAEETDTSVYPIRFGDAPATFPGGYQAFDSYRRTEYDHTWTSAENQSSSSPQPMKQLPVPTLTRPGKETDKLVKQVRAFFQALADKTGGRSFEFGSIDDVEATARSIVDELGQRYSLGYIPSDSAKDGERRTIKVQVNVPNAVVRARMEVVYRKHKH